MPRSKRAKVVHLSKTDKKGKEHSHKLFAGVRDAADQYQYCFIFSVDNMRNTYLKQVRSAFSDSRIFFGKTKVMAKALGSTPEEEHLPNIHELSEYLTGSVGLFFTSQDPSSVIDYFASYTEIDFARSGTVATRDFTLPAGVIYSRGGEIAEEEDVPVAHTLEPMLRKYGMPTKLYKGRIMLDDPYVVCEEGKELNSHQTALLKTFGIAMAEFRIQLKAYYNSATQEVKEVDAMEE